MDQQLVGRNPLVPWMGALLPHMTLLKLYPGYGPLIPNQSYFMSFMFFLMSSHFSGGEKQRLGIPLALASRSL